MILLTKLFIFIQLLTLSLHLIKLKQYTDQGKGPKIWQILYSWHLMTSGIHVCCKRCNHEKFQETIENKCCAVLCLLLLELVMAKIRQEQRTRMRQWRSDYLPIKVLSRHWTLQQLWYSCPWQSDCTVVWYRTSPRTQYPTSQSLVCNLAQGLTDPGGG